MLQAVKGGKDGWVIKTDNSGDIQWQRSYGGTNNDVFKAVLQTSDGGYMLTGYTYSNDGDVSGNHGNGDVWVVKIDGTGNLIWQKCLGGNNEEYGASIDRTVDNAFLVAGHTLSNDGDVSGNNGGADAWLVKLDVGGNPIWQRTVGTVKNEFGLSAIAVAEKEFAIAGYGEPITLPFSDVSDGVLSKLGSFNSIKGTLFYDKNSNGTKDANEPYFSEAIVKSEKTGYVRSNIPFNGFFRNDVDTGTYKTSVTFNSPYYTTAPLTYTSTFSSYFNNDSLNFAVQPIQGKRDLSITLIGLTPSRPGFQTQYKLAYKNQGTDTVATGTVQLIKSNKLTVVSTSPTYTSISGDTLRWNYTNLKPQDTASITLNFTVAAPPSVNVGDKLTSIATISPVATDLTPADDTSRLVQTVIGSYDPNDKSESHAGSLTQQQLAANEWLQYTIRFQNTGTDTAFNVFIRDTLSSKVDWNTLQMVSASHNYQLTINDNNKLSWAFNNILLVDSNRNEPLSHGYIVYRIKPATSLAAGDTVKNIASIYFDYNLPVATNRENTIVQSIVLPVKLLAFIAKREGISNLLQWNLAQEESMNGFEIERSIDGIYYTSIGKVNASSNGNYAFTDNKPAKAINYYRLKITSKDGSFEYSPIRTINNSGSFESSIYPNPAHDVLYLKIDSENKENLVGQVIDMGGKIILTKSIPAGIGTTMKAIDITTLKSGSYFIKITSSTKEQWVMKFEKL